MDSASCSSFLGIVFFQPSGNIDIVELLCRDNRECGKIDPFPDKHNFHFQLYSSYDISGCSSIGRALAWRARCTGFETLHSHFSFFCLDLLLSILFNTVIPTLSSNKNNKMNGPSFACWQQNAAIMLMLPQYIHIALISFFV